MWHGLWSNSTPGDAIDYMPMDPCEEGDMRRLEGHEFSEEDMSGLEGHEFSEEEGSASEEQGSASEEQGSVNDDEAQEMMGNCVDGELIADEVEDFKHKLQDCLDEVVVDGTFFSMQTTGKYINPGLQAKRVGNIGLPLSTCNAESIAEICKQSPFGKGDATIIDETVRKTWELDPSEFVCRNPAWAHYVDELAQQALQDLGVQSEVTASAQPYKLLLYGEGAFFKAHRDSEKVPGMFGTLVICLPSEHTGGEVHLVHGKKQHTLVTATESAFGLSALAWYSDVQHEIRPVTSGFRLVLTYNLVQDNLSDNMGWHGYLNTQGTL